MIRSLTHKMKPAAALLLMLTLIFTGCGLEDGANPLGSNQDTTGITPESFASFSLGDEPGGNTESTNRVHKIKAADGGTIKVEGERYEYIMEFPPGALDRDTAISVKVPDANEVAFNMAFQPQGTQFKKPVRLYMQLKVKKDGKSNEGNIADHTDIYYFNETTGQWEPQFAEVVVKNRDEGVVVTAEGILNHFSRYSLGGSFDDVDPEVSLAAKL